MDRLQLQSILTAAQTRLDADRDGELARSGMPSALACLSLALLEALADLDDFVPLTRPAGLASREPVA